MSPAVVPIDLLHQTIARDGFAFVRGPAMRQIVQEHGSFSDWRHFAGSWNDLALDTYMADGGRYRLRRHANYLVTAAREITRQPPRPHYQSLEYNVLHGRI